ncbi:protein kinase domain-containing protein [Globicatella sanguinis]|uniref:protein kinase domain-containing protein n=1 Tax=Globicatella sanguinis TaxID=13076 RepID=UPI0025436FE8|nr:protein kinase [Globicatella sanguinis]WIK67049.1 protein kinase [Globicatella sanguinis]WKT56454.1 protein kinase [Globicatella sanguinis]
MDISERVYKRIAEEFIGNGKLKTYKYKTGEELVELFNNYFNFQDKYDRGFPSRWLYVTEKIKIIGIENFFARILSSNFLRVEEGYTRQNVDSVIMDSLSNFNEILDPLDLVIKKVQNRISIQNIIDNEEIGHGGFAKVYFSKEKNIVIKKLHHTLKDDEAASNRFKREFDITKSLNDIPGIMKVFRFDSDKMFYEMEHCEYTLEKYIKNIKSNDDKYYLIDELLAIMSKVHLRNVIHRDLTPNNVFINNDQVVIGDFGLGKDISAEYSRYTKETSGLGQFYYIAPEQVNSLKDASYPADVFSLGKIINYIMTGSPNDNKHEFEYLTDKATAQNTENRYQNASLFYDSFKDFMRKKNRQYEQAKFEMDIASGQFSNDTNDYLLQLSIEEISDKVAENYNYVSAIKYLIEDQPQFSEKIIERLREGINKGYKWSSYDNFAALAFQVLTSNVKFNFDIRTSAAKLLAYTAYDVNRFYAQDLIQKIKKIGIEPTIEEILSEDLS